MPHLLPVSLFALSLTAFEPQTVVGEPLTFDRSALVSSQDAAALLDRIEDAARRVCRAEERYSAHLPRARRTCTRSTLRQVVTEISSPELDEALAQRLQRSEKARTN